MVGRLYCMRYISAIQVEVTGIVDHASLPVTLVEWRDDYDDSIGMMDIETFNDLFVEVED